MAIREIGRHFGEVVVLQPDAYTDERGYFMEAFRTDTLRGLGITEPFLQENQSWSKRGVVRGLHFQWDQPMGKLMRVISGEAFLVAVDLRPDSPTFTKWFGVVASPENRIQLWAPAGFARGFCVVSESAEVQYKCTALYNPKGEGGIRWNEPRIGVTWPASQPILSAKDAQAPSLDEWLTRPESSAPAFSVAPVRRPG